MSAGVTRKGPRIVSQARCLRRTPATGSTDTEDLLRRLLDTQLTPSQQLLLTLAHGYEPSRAANPTSSMPAVASVPDLGVLSDLLQQVDMHEEGGRQQAMMMMPAHARDSGSPAGQLTHHSNNTARMLRQVCELNCFSDIAMDPGYQVGQKLVASASEEQCVAYDAAEDCSMLSACEFLALAAGAQGRDASKKQSSPSQPTSRRNWKRQGCRSTEEVAIDSSGGGSHIGLWVEHAWMNHSCAPNVVNYVLGDAMVVRAGCDMVAGTELQDTYLGNDLHQPLQRRRQQLLESYGFTCQCSRCVAEEKLQQASPAAAALLASLQQRCSDTWEPRARQLLTSPKRDVQLSAANHRLNARCRLPTPTQIDLKRHQQCSYQHHQRRRSLLQSHMSKHNNRTSRMMWLSRLRHQRSRDIRTWIRRVAKQNRSDAVVDMLAAHDEMSPLVAEISEQVLAAEQLLSASSNKQSCSKSTNSREHENMFAPVMFPLFSCYELLALCLQHIVSCQQSGTNDTHETYEKLLANARKASALAEATVPGTDLHIGAASTAWVVMASWLEHLSNNEQSSWNTKELQLQLAEQQQQLTRALNIRYGSLEDQVNSQTGRKTADDCFTALMQARLL